MTTPSKIERAEGGVPWFVSLERRTHSVHHTNEEAKEAAFNLAYLTNGVPPGFLFGIEQRMGKFAFISYRAEARR